MSRHRCWNAVGTPCTLPFWKPLVLWAVVADENNEADQLDRQHYQRKPHRLKKRQVANRGDVWDSGGLSLAVYLTKWQAMDHIKDLRANMVTMKLRVSRFEERADTERKEK